MAKKGMKRPDETPEKKKKNEAFVPEVKAAAKRERPISEAYPAIDTDLARDNLQKDIPEADLQDI